MADGHVPAPSTRTSDGADGPASSMRLCSPARVSADPWSAVTCAGTAPLAGSLSSSDFAEESIRFALPNPRATRFCRIPGTIRRRRGCVHRRWVATPAKSRGSSHPSRLCASTQPSAKSISDSSSVSRCHCTSGCITRPFLAATADHGQSGSSTVGCCPHWSVRVRSSRRASIGCSIRAYASNPVPATPPTLAHVPARSTIHSPPRTSVTTLMVPVWMTPPSRAAARERAQLW